LKTRYINAVKLSVAVAFSVYMLT